jgi:hypothetical protein
MRSATFHRRDIYWSVEVEVDSPSAVLVNTSFDHTPRYSVIDTLKDGSMIRLGLWGSSGHLYGDGHKVLQLEVRTTGGLLTHAHKVGSRSYREHRGSVTVSWDEFHSGPIYFASEGSKIHLLSASQWWDWHIDRGFVVESLGVAY